MPLGRIRTMSLNKTSRGFARRLVFIVPYKCQVTEQDQSSSFTFVK